MRFGLLGPLAVSDGERPVPLTGVKQHALLALLALNAGRLVPADRLIESLWDDDGPRDLANALQHQISRLRAALGGDLIARRGPGYALDVPPDAVDVRRFERLASGTTSTGRSGTANRRSRWHSRPGTNGRARAKQTLALVLGAAGEPERAAKLLAEARPTIVATGDDFWVAGSDLIAATGAARSGRLDVAERTGTDILTRARRSGYEPFECWARLLLATAAERRGDPGATGELEAALEVAGRLGLPHYVAFVRAELGRLAMLDGDLPRARALQEEAVTAAEEGDSPWHAALARCGLAETLRQSGDGEAAEAMFRAVRTWAESPGARRTRATFFTALGGSPYARCLLGLGLLTEARRPAESLGLLTGALRWAEQSHDHPAAAAALEGLAGSAWAAGDAERAALLLGAATAHRSATAHPLHPRQRGEVDRLAAEIRTTEAFARGCRLTLREAIALAEG